MPSTTPRSTPTSERFRDAWRSVVGQECWSVVAGAGTGSAILIDFGTKRLRDRPIDNLALREDQRLYESDFSLYVRCAWRLESNDRVVCVWSDFDHDTGDMPPALSALEGQRVAAVDIDEPAWDIRLRIGADLYLRLFCDASSDPDAGEDNYSLTTPAGTFVVGAASQLELEPATAT